MRRNYKTLIIHFGYAMSALAIVGAASRVSPANAQQHATPELEYCMPNERGGMSYRVVEKESDIAPAGTGTNPKPYVQGFVGAISLGTIDPDGTVHTGMLNNHGSINGDPGKAAPDAISAASRVCKRVIAVKHFEAVLH